MSLRPARDMSLGRWLLVACFSSVKNHNVSGPHLFHGLVVPHWVKWRGSAGQTHCPCSTCSTESEDPLVLVPLVPRSSGDPLLPVPLVPLMPTCTNLCHLVEPLVLYQLSFLRFFCGFLNVIPFLEKLFWLKIFFIILSCWRGQITRKFLRKDRDNRDNTLDHVGLFCLEFNSSTLWHQHTKQTLFESTTHCV